MADLFLTFIGECQLVFTLVGEALSRLVLGFHLCGRDMLEQYAYVD